MNELAIQEAVAAWIKMYLRIKLEHADVGERNTFDDETADDVLARHGVRYDEDPLRWSSHERAVRQRALARIAIMPPAPERPKRSRRERVDTGTKPCAYCGEQFSRHRRGEDIKRFHKRRFCGITCSSASRRTKRRPAR